MIISNINSKQKYEEKENIDKNDIGLDSELYEYFYNDIKIIISLGKINNTKINMGLLFTPIYLIYKKKVVSKIGILEIEPTSNIYDEEGDIDLNKCNEPLFFNFVNKTYLSKYSDNTEISEDTNETEDMKHTYNEEMNDVWINDFMGSEKYTIKDNDGNGDCFFLALIDAFSTINENKNVNELREILVKNVSVSIYESYKQIYNSCIESINDNNNKIKNIQKINKDLEQKIKNTNIVGEHYDIICNAKKKSDEYNNYIQENNSSRELLNEYEFMSTVESYDDFKNILMSNIFWADTWAISVIERELNIKIILLSSENYENGDIDNVLLCSQENNDTNYNPECYIIMDYNGLHYKLISYNYNSVFNIETLPNEVKELIHIKCQENEGGTYKYIDNKQTTNSEDNIYYDIKENTEFMISPKSSDKPKPGCGNGEKILMNNIIKYKELNNVKNWRQKLSTYNISPFTLDNLKWNTIEHYYQGSKFKNIDSNYYKSFSLDSDSYYNNDPTLAKKEINKKIKLCDIDFNSEKVLEDAYKQSINENSELKKILLLTKGAKLKLYCHKRQPIEMSWLMTIRKNII